MIKAENNRIDKEKCMKFCMNKRKIGDYKYFTEIMLHRDDREEYFRYLQKCEKSNQEFVLVYIDTREEYKLLGGFSDFKLKPSDKTSATDFYSSSDGYDDCIESYFYNWQERCKYYFISSNIGNTSDIYTLSNM